MVVLERREVHMRTALVVKYYTDGEIKVTGEEDGREDPSLVEKIDIQQNPAILKFVQDSETRGAPDVLREEVRRRHAHQGGMNDIKEFLSWTFIVGPHSCVCKLENGVWNQICR
jgi:hypothetical protein